jgi:hypothetical protein
METEKRMEKTTKGSMANMDKIDQPQYKGFFNSVMMHSDGEVDEKKLKEHYLKFLYQQNMKKHKKKYKSKTGQIIRCVHEDGCFPYIGKLVQKFNPELVLELGFSWGGMTKLFEDYTKARIHAYNKRCGRSPNISFFGPRVSFHWNDILSKPLPHLVNLCKDSRYKLLYCDNGNKINEIYMYGQYLNIGDMIGAHDYPKEIYHDWELLIGKTKIRNTRKDVDRMNAILESFEPVEHDLMLEHGFSDRFWIKTRNIEWTTSR